MSPGPFAFLQDYPSLRRPLEAAETYAHSDPTTALAKLRLFGEKLTRELAQEHGFSLEATTSDLQAGLRQRGVLNGRISRTLREVRQTGNRAVHEDEGDTAQVLALLPGCVEVAAWFVVRRGGTAPSVPYVPPRPLPSRSPEEQARDLRAAFLAVDARLSALGIAARASLGPADVRERFVPPRFTEEEDAWDALVEGLSRGKRFAVLGTPGAGKSTLARAAGALLASNEEGPVPILLPAASWAEHTLPSVIRRAREGLQVPLEPATLERWLEEGRVVLLLDGLDEARHLEALQQDLRAFLRGWPRASLLVTSRPTAFERASLEGFTTLHLAPWVLLDACLFLEAALGTELSERLWRAQFEQRHLRAFLESPLLATLLALHTRERGEPPSSRQALFDGAVRTLLDTWPAHRRSAPPGLSLDEQWRAVEELAAASLEPDFVASFDGIVAAVGRGRQGERWVEHLIDETGLLVPEGPDRYRWLHLALRDHLAIPALLRSGVTVEAWVADRFGTDQDQELLLDLVIAASDRPGLAGALLAALRDRPPHGYGAWYGASHDDWTDFFVRCVREGLPLDEATANALLDFLADDQLRIARAFDQNVPTGPIDGLFPDLDPDNGLLDDIGINPFALRVEGAIDDATVARWLERRLSPAAGDPSAAVVLGLACRDERALTASLQGRLGALFWMWPRSMVGKRVGQDRGRKWDEPWPGDGLALASGFEVGLDPAVRHLSGASDWWSRGLTALLLPAGPALREALCWLIARQALSLGGVGARLQPPFPALRVAPGGAVLRLRVPVPASLAGHVTAAERARGPDRKGRGYPALGELLRMARLRNILPTGMEIEELGPWPDATALDALGPEEMLAATESLQAFFRSAGLLSPEMYLYSSETGAYTGVLRDAIPLTLVPAAMEPLPDPRARPTPTEGDAQANARAAHAAELVAAALATRGLPAERRLAHLQHRLQCRATLHLWPAIEERVHRPSFDASAEALLAAMAWAQSTLTGAWPDGAWWQGFMETPPELWLARVFWHASWLEASPARTPAHRRHRRRLDQAIIEGGAHPVAALFRERERG